MKILFCAKCFTMRSFGENNWIFCDCRRIAARWIDANKGTVDVLATDKTKAFVIGMNNNFLRGAIDINNRPGLNDLKWQELHNKSTDAQNFLFDKAKRACWACIIKVGESSDVFWNPAQKYIDEFGYSIDEAISKHEN